LEEKERGRPRSKKRDVMDRGPAVERAEPQARVPVPPEDGGGWRQRRARRGVPLHLHPARISILAFLLPPRHRYHVLPRP